MCVCVCLAAQRRALQSATRRRSQFVAGRIIIIITENARNGVATKVVGGDNEDVFIVHFDGRSSLRYTQIVNADARRNSAANPTHEKKNEMKSEKGKRQTNSLSLGADTSNR